MHLNNYRAKVELTRLERKAYGKKHGTQRIVVGFVGKTQSIVVGFVVKAQSIVVEYLRLDSCLPIITADFAHTCPIHPT